MFRWGIGPTEEKHTVSSSKKTKLLAVDLCTPGNIVHIKYSVTALNKYIIKYQRIYHAHIYTFRMPCSCKIIYSYVILYDGNMDAVLHITEVSVKFGTSFWWTMMTLAIQCATLYLCESEIECGCRCVIHMHGKNKIPRDLCSFTFESSHRRCNTWIKKMGFPCMNTAWFIANVDNFLDYIFHYYYNCSS